MQRHDRGYGFKRRGLRALALVFGWLGLWGVLPGGTAGAAEPALRMRVLGNLAATGRYEELEQSFWRRSVPRLTEGRVVAELAAYDRGGLRVQEVLPLLRLGVVSFATVPITVAAAEEPRFGAPDLPMLNRDIAALRRAAEAWRPVTEAVLAERYGARLLGYLTYPAQVPFCVRPITSLEDLRGRRVRTSSGPQALLVQRLGGIAVTLPYADSPRALAEGMVECVITGTTPGIALGLQRLAPYVLATPVSWGLSVVVASEHSWQALTPRDRAALLRGLVPLQEAVWRQAEEDSDLERSCGSACGPHGIRITRPAAELPATGSLRRALVQDWAAMCGAGCATAWDQRLAGPTGIRAAED